MNDCDSIKCPKCGGAGRVKLSKPYQKCVAAIRTLGRPTMLELHFESGSDTTHTTATNKRVMRLAAAGAVRILDGRPMRVELV